MELIFFGYKMELTFTRIIITNSHIIMIQQQEWGQGLQPMDYFHVAHARSKKQQRLYSGLHITIYIYIYMHTQIYIDKVERFRWEIPFHLFFVVPSIKFNFFRQLYSAANFQMKN